MKSVPKRGPTRLVVGGELFKLSLAVAVTVALLVLETSPAAAQAPDESWRTITTEHFRVTFPERLEALARRAADRAEWAYDALAEAFIDPPDGMIDVLVTDHTDQSNGFAQVTPSNRMTVYARPPVDLPSLGYFNDWMELVILHELAHIVHLDDTRNPLGRLARSVFGRIGSEWPFFPSLATPRWTTEGLATWYESLLTGSGRIHGTFQEMQLRTAVLEGRFEGIGQAGGDSPLWPGGNRPYAYGALFFQYLLTKHGADRMATFVEAVSGQWIPYRLNAAGRDAFGASLSDEWDAWEADVRAQLADLDERLMRHGPITEPERLTTDARWGFHPLVSRDGESLAYVRSDGRSDSQISLADPEGRASGRFARTNGLSTFDWLPDGRLLVAQLELADPYRSYSDLYVMAPGGGQARLTEGARLADPSVAADGRSAVAVRSGDGTNGLVRVDLETGAVTTLVPAADATHWAFARISPNGRWIAATRWEPNAYTDIVILDAQSGDVLQRVTNDRAIDLAPRWGPQSRWIVWGSDRTGIPNVYGAEIDPTSGRAAEPVMLTNVRTGASFPSIDPSGRWLYFTGYHVDGWDVERTPFLGSAARPAPATDARFAEPVPLPTRGASAAEVEQYDAGVTLRPTYWEVSFRDPIVFPGRITSDGDTLRRREGLGYALGVQTSGRDLVGRHAYSLFARTFLEGGGRTEAGFGYSHAGLGNPIVSLAATQRYDDAGQVTAGTAPDTLFILERERGLETAVTFRAPRWRHNLSITASAAMIWESLDLLDRSLESTGAYLLPRPAARLGEVALSGNFVTSRSHSFQMGTTRGLTLFALGRLRTQLALPDSLVSVAGVDRSFGEVIGRARGAIPLWTTGRVTHVLALQASGGAATGPGAGAGFYGVGGASGQRENLTGGELFGGNFILFPVRGYARSSRFGRFAWAISAEYRFPLALFNWALGAWPLHLDQVAGSIFFDAGNAWGPDPSPVGFSNPLRSPLASIGAEVTTEFLGLYDTELRLRSGVGVPLVEGSGARVYLRVGLPF